jgi:phage tail sheath protein FI
MVDGFLNDILVKRGLMDYATVCDESNNDGTRIDRNELWIDVALKPMKSAEFIYIPISIVNSSASF